MKLRSVISLIIAAALILVGIITCVVASTMADAADVMLFPTEDESGNLVYRMDISGTSKITVDSADADITVVGGAKESTIEVINFNANYYKLSESNGALVFGQVDDFLSMFKFWENGFSFKGMRYILRYGDDAAGKKQVVIRLADDSDVDLVQLSSDKGNISVKDCAFSANYTARSHRGSVEFENITSALSLNISGKTPHITIDKCDANKLMLGSDVLTAAVTETTAQTTGVIAEDGDVSFTNCNISEISADMIDGNISLSPYSCSVGEFKSTSGKISIDMTSTESLKSDVSTVTGKISVNGEFTEGFYYNAPSPENILSISTEDGDIYITYPKTEK